MAKIFFNGQTYSMLDFESENEFEKAVIENKNSLFGQEAIYIDVKKRMGENISYHKGIPDGYLIDFFDKNKPQLYFVENELASHDVYGHITEQVARFYSSITSSIPQIKHKLLDHIKNDKKLLTEIEEKMTQSIFQNVDELLNYLTEKNEIKIVVVIDDITADLNLGMKIFRNKPDVVLLQKYMSDNEICYFYEPMRDEVADLAVDSKKSNGKVVSEFDTVVCPAFEDGFKHAYMDNNAWWEVRLSQGARERLKYLAIYQKSPLAEIKHIAEIEKIEPYKDTDKFIIYLKNKKNIAPIKLDKGLKGIAPQGPRYTTLEKIMKSKKISELWS